MSEAFSLKLIKSWNARAAKDARRARYRVSRDGVMHAKAGDVLESKAVRDQLSQIAELHRLINQKKDAGEGKATQARRDSNN